jgi:hypothetical protein
VHGGGLQGDGLLAVCEGGVEAFEGDVGCCMVREVCWFGGDEIYMGIGDRCGRSVSTSVLWVGGHGGESKWMGCQSHDLV